jgi:hypothetical protein
MRELLQGMMWPSDEVFQRVVHARNVEKVDTGTLIRTFVSEYAKTCGVDLGWPHQPVEMPVVDDDELWRCANS